MTCRVTDHAALSRSRLRRLLALTLLGACTHTANSSRATSVAGGMPGARARSATVFRQRELISTGEPTLYRALQLLRPDLFMPRQRTPQAPVGFLPPVYFNERLLGDVNALQDIPLHLVHHVEVVSAADATIHFGRPLPAGAIVVRGRF